MDFTCFTIVWGATCLIPTDLNRTFRIREQFQLVPPEFQHKNEEKVQF